MNPTEQHALATFLQAKRLRAQRWMELYQEYRNVSVTNWALQSTLEDDEFIIASIEKDEALRQPSTTPLVPESEH